MTVHGQSLIPPIHSAGLACESGLLSNGGRYGGVVGFASTWLA